MLFDLAFVRHCAINTSLFLDARGGRQWLKADWETPGGGAIFRLLKFSCFGAPPVRWFSQIDPAAPGLHPRYRWSARVMRWGGALAGVPFPPPEHVPLDDALPIVEWMADVLRSRRTPHLFAFASAVVRVCQTAGERGIDLRGAQFTMIGEPVTVTRLREVGRVGAKAVPRYGTIESGPIGYGCLAPDAPDDVHLLHDLHALIQPGREGEAAGLPAGTLLISSLCPIAPVMLLNVSLGDQAILVERRCDCPLERLGWSTHLHTIRSFEKLTAAGMTFLGADVIRVLEEVLPARFGGGPTHYQLLEEEGEDGRPRLRLLVHPAVGPVDSAVVGEAFLQAISSGSGTEKVMGTVWRGAGVLRVERAAPMTTASGKILHLHVGRPPGREA